MKYHINRSPFATEEGSDIPAVYSIYERQHKVMAWRHRWFWIAVAVAFLVGVAAGEIALLLSAWLFP